MADIERARRLLIRHGVLPLNECQHLGRALEAVAFTYCIVPSTRLLGQLINTDHRKGSEDCAFYVRVALEAAGVDTSKHPVFAQPEPTND